MWVPSKPVAGQNNTTTLKAMSTRTEYDLLGEMKLSDDLYYGIHTQRAIDNFQISNTKVGDYPFFVRGMVLTKKACALANGEIGTIPVEKANLPLELFASR